MTRKTHLTTLDLHRLDLACEPLTRAFGHWTYLVGSVTERADFRDVDVRTILPDIEFDRLFHGQSGVWEAFCLGIASWLGQQTGLPIDYQVQRMTEANAKHPGGFRNPLGTGRHFAGGGDATTFNPPSRRARFAEETP